MTYQQYLEKNKELQDKILQFIDKEKEEQEIYDNLKKYFNDPNFIENRHNLKTTLYLILKISNNHHRSSYFFRRIEQLLLLVEDQIKQTFSNFEIFSIFKSNKRLLLFLIKRQLIIPDSSIVNIFSNPRHQYTNSKYQNYLLPEIESFLDKSISKKIKGQISHMLNIRVKNLTESEQFEEKRKNGENDGYLCQLIQNDSIEEFIIHVNKTNLSLKTKIKVSIYETNRLLLKNEPSLIEYAAFFGSIQIFQYLKLNKIQIKPSIWLYAIYGRNPEVIHAIEELGIKPPNDDFQECLNESLKCHHFEITDYIINNLMTINDSKDENKIFALSTKYLNFQYFPKDFTNLKTFYYLCKYDHVDLVNLLMNDENVKIESQNIFNKKLFY